MGNKPDQSLNLESDTLQENFMLPAYQWLGQQDYLSFLTKMQQQRLNLSKKKANEVVWFCEHNAVYTTGKRGIKNNTSSLDAPLITTDRGGETTFHGKGQLMMYPMIKLKSYHLSVRDYVFLLEESCIRLLHSYEIQAKRNCGLPGVWVHKDKIAALGIRIGQGITSHGIALNINTDLCWFDKISPCGTSRKMTTMTKQGVENLDVELISQQWFQIFKQLLEIRSKTRSV